MKYLISSLVVLFFCLQLNSQDLKDSRVVYSYVNTYIDYKMIDTWDPGTLTASETKKHNEWKKRLTARILDRVIEKSDAFLTENGVAVQPLETAGQFGFAGLTTEGYPSIGFPKRALKKKGEKLDVGDYFISYHVTFDKGGARPSLKGYTPAFELQVKVFSKVGEKLKDFKTKGLTEKKVGVVSMKVKPEYFSRVDFESIDWIMEGFGPGLDDAIDEALPQLLK